MTENEAKKKYCPMPTFDKCRGSQCMWWRIFDVKRTEGNCSIEEITESLNTLNFLQETKLNRS